MAKKTLGFYGYRTSFQDELNKFVEERIPKQSRRQNINSRQSDNIQETDLVTLTINGVRKCNLNIKSGRYATVDDIWVVSYLKDSRFSKPRAVLYLLGTNEDMGIIKTFTRHNGGRLIVDLSDLMLYEKRNKDQPTAFGVDGDE